jgi:hypothetical protein
VAGLRPVHPARSLFLTALPLFYPFGLCVMSNTGFNRRRGCKKLNKLNDYLLLQ